MNFKKNENIFFFQNLLLKPQILNFNENPALSLKSTNKQPQTTQSSLNHSNLRPSRGHFNFSRLESLQPRRYARRGKFVKIDLSTTDFNWMWNFI